MSERGATVLLTLVLGLTALVIVCYAAIFIQPNLPINPFSPAQATRRAELSQPPAVGVQPPTSTPDQSYPPTWTPTATSTPEPTRTPTETRTPTATKPPTSTPTLIPSRTPTPRPTNTPLPATNTPLPPPFSVASHSGEPNCSIVGVKGVVSDAQGLPMSGVQLQVGEVGVAGSLFTVTTDANGRYAFNFLGTTKKQHTWFVVPLENGQPGADRFQWVSDPNLDDDDDDDEGGGLCNNADAIMVKTVNWRRRPDVP